MFTLALFTITKIRRQPECPQQMSDWFKKIQYVCVHIYMYIHAHTYLHTHMMEYYSAINNNEMMPFSARWIDLENIIISEIRQTYIISLICRI